MKATHFYFSNDLSQVKICFSEQIDDFDLFIFLCSKRGKLNARHYHMLSQFKLTTGHYMMSEQLLMTISRITKIDFEDLWNEVYMKNRDQIDLKRVVVRTKRTDNDIDGFVIC